MKMIVLHGENTAKSFERLSKFVDSASDRGWEIVRIGNTNTNLADTLRTQGLFGDNRLFLIENIKSLAKKDYDYLKKLEDDITLVAYSDKELTKTQISSFPSNTKFESFMIPKKIWIFLDSIYPKNSKACITLFSEVCETEAPAEMILALIARQLRDVFLLKKGISANTPSWKIGKLTNQVKRFSDAESVKDMLFSLSEIDIKVKTSDYNLKDELAFLMATKLQ